MHLGIQTLEIKSHNNAALCTVLCLGILVSVISGILGRVVEDMAPKIRNSYGVLFEKIHILQIATIKYISGA